MFDLDDSIPVELAPLAFLIGTWQGTGVISYPTHEGEFEFSQQITFSHDGESYLTYVSTAKLNDEKGTVLPSEVGYWRIARPAEDADHGPGLLPGKGEPTYKTREDLEQLRNATGGFDIEASIIHPSGISEHYLGQVKAGRIDIRTVEGSSRSENSKAYAGAVRIYGLVEGALLWAWDIAALGQDLESHASARLEKVS
ncbi:MAG: FABP family protein [Micrococcales bacterium]